MKRFTERVIDEHGSFVLGLCKTCPIIDGAGQNIPKAWEDRSVTMDDIRLIDANKLLSIFCAGCGMRDGSCSNSCEKDCAIYDTITSAPTVEAQPVKHGKWIEKKVSRMKWIPYADDNVNPDNVGIERMTEQKCSYCKRWTVKFTDHIELDYCPLCGARMDGDGG